MSHKTLNFNNALTGHATCLHSTPHVIIFMVQGEKEAMRKSFAVISGVLIVWAAGPATAFAFEQTPLAPSPPASITAPAEPAVKFGDETPQPESRKKGGGLKIPGLGKWSLPKLNFGLDLMYGSPAKDDSDLRFSGESPRDDDVTILGKVKRRF